MMRYSIEVKHCVQILIGKTTWKRKGNQNFLTQRSERWLYDDPTTACEITMASDPLCTEKEKTFTLENIIMGLSRRKNKVQYKDRKTKFSCQGGYSVSVSGNFLNQGKLPILEMVWIWSCLKPRGTLSVVLVPSRSRTLCLRGQSAY